MLLFAALRPFLFFSFVALMYLSEGGPTPFFLPPQLNQIRLVWLSPCG